MAAIPAPARAQSIPALVEKPSKMRSPRVEIIALTGDDALLEQIGQALDGEATFRHVESVDAAREFIRPMRPCVLLLDARGHQDLPATVESVQSPDGTCIVVVLATADESANVARSVKGSATFAILSIPVEQGQTIAVLDGAREEAQARLTLAEQAVVKPTAPAPQVSIAPPLAGDPAPSESAPVVLVPSSTRSMDRHGSAVPPSRKATTGTAGSVGGSKRQTQAVVLAGIVLIVITAAWLSLRAPHTDDRARATAAAPESHVAEPVIARPATDAAAVLEGSSEELLDRARVAMNARHYTDPEGDNALAYFRAVLAQDSQNDEAREGLQRIGALLDERLQAELAQRRLSDAAGTLVQLKVIRPGDPGLARIEVKLAEAQIAAAIDAGNVERASQLLRQASQLGTLTEPSAAHWRDEISRRQGDARSQQLAQLVSLRIGAGKLVDPAADSAKAYLAQLRRMPSDPKGLASAATAELQQALLLKVRDAAAQSNSDDLDRWLAEARALGVSPTRISAAMRATPPAATAPPVLSQSERLARLVEDRINDGRLLEPSADSALAYLNALRATDPSGSAVAASTRLLSDALLQGGRNALADRNLEAALTNASAARRLGVNLADVDTLERGIAAARTRTVPRQLPPSDLKRTRYVPPEYPQDALKRAIGGEVRVRITVDADGKVKSAAVVNSSPADVFDRAALDAVRRWRFKPLAADNPNLEATVVTSIVFRPDDVKAP